MSLLYSLRSLHYTALFVFKCFEYTNHATPLFPLNRRGDRGGSRVDTTGGVRFAHRDYLYFSLDGKVSKDQDKTMLLRSSSIALPAALTDTRHDFRQANAGSQFCQACAFLTSDFVTRHLSLVTSLRGVFISFTVPLLQNCK